jgi:hypothetical protein
LRKSAATPGRLLARFRIASHGDAAFGVTLLMHAIVRAAEVQDRHSGVLLMAHFSAPSLS